MPIARAICLVAVVPLTTWKQNRRVYPTEVLLPMEATTSLPSVSLALCHQLRAISSRRLSPAGGRLEDRSQREGVEQAARLWLAM